MTAGGGGRGWEVGGWEGGGCHTATSATTSMSNHSLQFKVFCSRWIDGYFDVLRSVNREGSYQGETNMYNEVT